MDQSQGSCDSRDHGLCDPRIRLSRFLARLPRELHKIRWPDHTGRNVWTRRVLRYDPCLNIRMIGVDCCSCTGSVYGAFQGYARAFYAELLPPGEEARWLVTYEVVF